MDIGDWVFLGMIVISGIASVSKAAKKKTAGQTSGEQTTTHQEKSDSMDEWIKKMTKSLVGEDEFIPKNETQPTVIRPVEPTPQPVDTERKRTTESAQPYTNAEQFRRKNQSLEGSARPNISLEQTNVVEGKVSHTGLRGSAQVSQTDLTYEKPYLDPADDFGDTDEVRKAIIYGEIMRTKF
jgi:hypothetical protein